MNSRHKGKEGNLKKIQKGSIIIPYPREAIYYREEGSILIQVYKKSNKSTHIKILKASPYERLNKASIEAIKKALLSIKKEDSINQKLQIEFKLKNR